MAVLLLGLTLFIAVHLLPALYPQARQGLIEKLGAQPYRGLFALLVLLGVVLIVVGWRTANPSHLFAPANWLRYPAMAIIAVGFLLMVASSRPTVIKRWLAHPQLTGLALWALAHLLVNGDSRSLLLFGALAVWARLEIWVLRRRDGVPEAPPTTGIGSEVLTVAIAAVVFLIAGYLHPWFAGVVIW